MIDVYETNSKELLCDPFYLDCFLLGQYIPTTNLNISLQYTLIITLFYNIKQLF